jgi:hypothetical protein
MRPLGAALATLLVLAGCAADRRVERSVAAEHEHQPPPKPGSSITHTRMCTCQTCEPSACCDGPETPEPVTCDSYDFSKCEISVSSCASRCFQHVWRAPLSDACETRRPAACCGG